MCRAVRRIITTLVLWDLTLKTVTEGYEMSDGLLRERRKKNEAPETLSIKYHHDDKVEEVVLKKVMNTIPSSLLPIWDIVQDDDVSEQYLLPEFVAICYHGVDSYSAITYFPHTKTLYGVIDHRFFIDALPFSDAENPDLVKNFMHPMLDDTTIPDLPPMQHREKRMVGTARIANDLRCSSYKNFRKTLYAEILLVVDSTIRIDYYLRHPHEKLVMYALAYWNAIDMLFSHLKRTEIKINIAGIVVGETADVVEFFDPVGYTVDDDSKIFVLNQAALDALGKKFHSRDIEVNRDSYDFLLWMTEASLMTPRGRNTGGPELGIATDPADCGGTHDEEERTGKISNRAVVMHDAQYTNYQTAARVLASMMFVSIDDLRKPDGLSMGPSRGIMDPSNERVEGCLRWSYRSEIDFIKYASSKSSCCLLNFPYRTMGEPFVPVQRLTVDKQCQCYKMESHEQVDYNGSICGALLQCKDRHGQFSSVGLPLDGTPCQDSDAAGICRRNNCVSL